MKKSFKNYNIKTKSLDKYNASRIKKEMKKYKYVHSTKNIILSSVKRETSKNNDSKRYS